MTMERVSFPQNVRKAAVLEKTVSRALNRSNLTLSKCENLAHRILSEPVDSAIAIPLLNRVEQRRQELVQRQVERLNKAQTPLARLELLIPIIEDLEPEEVGRQLEAIRVDVAVSNDPRIEAVVRRQLEHVHFAQIKPIVNDLKAFTGQIERVAKAILQTHSLQPLKGLNRTQLHEVQLVEAQ